MEGKRSPGCFKDCEKEVPSGPCAALKDLAPCMRRCCFLQGTQAMGWEGQSVAQSTLRLKDTGGQVQS